MNKALQRSRRASRAAFRSCARSLSRSISRPLAVGCWRWLGGATAAAGADPASRGGRNIDAAGLLCLGGSLGVAGALLRLQRRVLRRDGLCLHLDLRLCLHLWLHFGRDGRGGSGHGKGE